MIILRLILSIFSFATFGFLYGQNDVDTLKIGYTSAVPFIIEQNDGLDGISVRLWTHVARHLDIPFKYERLEFTDIDSRLSNGSIDLVINPLTITSERKRLYHFTTPFFVSHSIVAIHESGSFRRIIKIVRTFLSFNFLRTLGLLMSFVFVFGLLTWLFERKTNSQQFKPGRRGIWDGLWWSAVTMTTVGYGDKAPKTVGGRIVALIWMFTAIVFISGLTATVASTLLMSELDSSFVSLDQLKRKKVATLAGTSTEQYLDAQFFRNVTLYDDMHHALEDLEDSKIDAFVYDESIVKYRLRELDRHLHIELLPIKFDLQLYAFAVSKKRAELVDPVSLAILEYVESLEWKALLAEYELAE